MMISVARKLYLFLIFLRNTNMHESLCDCGSFLQSLNIMLSSLVGYGENGNIKPSIIILEAIHNNIYKLYTLSIPKFPEEFRLLDIMVSLSVDHGDNDKKSLKRKKSW